MNAVKETTSIDQVIALAIRIYKFLRRLIDNFDGVTVQDAIIHREHPFWGKLCEAAKTLELPLNFIQLDCVFPIRTGGNRSCIEIINGIVPEWQSRINGTVLAICETTLDKPGVESKDVVDYDIVLLYPTKDVPYQQILVEFAKRGWENSCSKDALRVLEDHPDAHIAATTGKYRHYVTFINESNPSESLEIGYDAMGSIFIDPVKRLRGCYAARRKRV